MLVSIFFLDWPEGRWICKTFSFLAMTWSFRVISETGESTWVLSLRYAGKVCWFHATLPQDTVVRDIGVRVMNELVMPFKAIQMDDTEFACLKVSTNTCPSLCATTKTLGRLLCSLIRMPVAWATWTGSRASVIRSRWTLKTTFATDSMTLEAGNAYTFLSYLICII